MANPSEDAVNTGHPLLRDAHVAQNLMKALQNRDKAQEWKVEQLEEWKASVNRLAASPDGRVFIRAMLEFSGYNLPGDIGNTVKMVEDNGKQAFYKRWVRPFLSKELRIEVEP